jgi:hypothetical protein
MPTPITEDRFFELLRTFRHTAFRLELQQDYREPTEVDTIQRFAAGDPQDPTEVPSLAAWFDQVRDLTTAGRTIERVRVQDEPPTACQRWERWIGAWASAAGEHLRYMTRSDAFTVGLLPAAGNTDWWLLDDEQLILMKFRAGRRIWTATSADPNLIQQARTWRDLAVRHSVLDVEGAIPAP